MMADCKQEKQALRSSCRAYRLALPPPLKQQWDMAICEAVCRDMMYRQADSLLLYASLALEVDTWALCSRALADGKSVAFPCCEPETHQMEFYRVFDTTVLTRSHYGIAEPPKVAQMHVSDDTNALCIVPGLSFTRAGMRLGYGGGYYDRFLAAHPALWTIGLCYDAQLAVQLPVDCFDQSVMKIITEKTMEVCHAG